MNERTPPIGTSVALQIPADARELRELATFISTSRLIPQQFQKSPADCWMVLDFCREKGLNFFATIGHCSIIRNNLFFDGQLCGALLNISRFLAGPINHELEYDKNGNATAVITSARLSGEATPRSVRVELDSVKTKNEVWNTQPEQQLCYSGNRIWGRRYLPEVLLGMTFKGEDITIDVTPNPNEAAYASGSREVVTPQIRRPANDDAKRPDAHSEETAATGPIVRIHDEALAKRVAYQVAANAQAREAANTETTTDEVAPFTIPRRGEDAADWSAWAQTLMAYIRAAPDVNVAVEWRDRNGAAMVDLERHDKAKHARLNDMINHNFAMRREQDDAQ